MALKSLTSVFESKQSILKEKLQGLQFPSDVTKIQNIINTFFNELLDNEGDFRQNLTVSEDYILQAAISLLNAKENIYNEINSNAKTNRKQMPEELNETPSNNNKISKARILAGTAIGSGLGGAIIGTWGAVFGAIAGAAVSIYYSSIESNISHNKEKIIEKYILPDSNLNIELLISIVRKLCENIDLLIDTFRAQINRVISKYENQDKPTLETNYVSLLERIQSLLGYKRYHVVDERYVRKIQERIEDISEILECYNLVVEDYTDERKYLFEIIQNPNVSNITPIFPAIIKGNSTVLKGRIFIPEYK